MGSGCLGSVLGQARGSQRAACGGRSRRLGRSFLGPFLGATRADKRLLYYVNEAWTAASVTAPSKDEATGRRLKRRQRALELREMQEALTSQGEASDARDHRLKAVRRAAEEATLKALESSGLSASLAPVPMLTSAVDKKKSNVDKKSSVERRAALRRAAAGASAAEAYQRCLSRGLAEARAASDTAYALALMNDEEEDDDDEDDECDDEDEGQEDEGSDEGVDESGEAMERRAGLLADLLHVSRPIARSLLLQVCFMLPISLLRAHFKEYDLSLLFSFRFVFRLIFYVKFLFYFS